MLAAKKLPMVANENAPPVALNWLDTAAIFAPLPPVPYVLEALDLCPGAPALIAGYGFSGKTLASQSLLMSVAAGLDVWGQFKAKTGRVAHIDYEQGSRLTRERYQRLAQAMMVGPTDLADRLRLLSMPPMYLDGTVAEDVLCRDLEGCTIAVFDSLRASAPSYEENSSDVRKTLDMLGRVSERTGCAMVMIHHARKPSQTSQGGAKMSIRGSGAIFDACSSVLVFDASEKNAPIRVSHEKARNSGRLAEDFHLTITDVPSGANDRWGVMVSAEAIVEESEESRIQRTNEALCERILTILRKESLPTKNAIALQVGGRKANAWAAIDILVGRGQVEKTNDGFRAVA